MTFIGVELGGTKLAVAAFTRDGTSRRTRFFPSAIVTRISGRAVLAAVCLGVGSLNAQNRLDRAVKGQTLPEALEWLWQGYPK